MNGKLLPVVGAGMSLNALLPKRKRMPLWGDLSKALTDQLSDYSPSSVLDGISAYEPEVDRARLIERLSELCAGRRALERKVRRYHPRVVAIVGIGAYRVAFDRPRATMGSQDEPIAGAQVWVVPNTSGLNANHRPADFARAFSQGRRAAEKLAGSPHRR